MFYATFLFVIQEKKMIISAVQGFGATILSKLHEYQLKTHVQNPLMTTGYENLRLGLYGEMDKIGHKHKMREYTRETISF